MKKIISLSLSPNVEPDDVLVAIRILFQPWTWRNGHYTQECGTWFRDHFPEFVVFDFNSGRSALLEICRAFGFQSGDEVLIQSFTCVAVPNSVIWAGATPVYVDIDTTLNIDLADAQKKITKRTRAIIVQHTFGMTANMEKLKKFAQMHKLLLIEDCAHALGATFDSSLLGSFGDASFFSFGRDKVLSSVFGGIALINARHERAIRAMRSNHQLLPHSRIYWILQQLLHPILFSIILPLYRSGVGKVLLVLFQKALLLSFPVYPEEKRASKPADFPAKYSNALAGLLVHQLSKLAAFNARRKKIAQLYMDAFAHLSVITLLTYPEESIFLRFPVLVNDPERVIRIAKQHGILLGNWYHNIVDPIGVDFSKIYFDPEGSPRAKNIASHILNLPTNISPDEARQVIHLLCTTLE